MKIIKKISNIYTIIIFGALISLPLIYLCIEWVVNNNFPTNLSNEIWVNFLGNYIGGIVGGIIAIVGISYQLFREKNEKTERVKKYINFIIDKNLKIENLIDSERLISYTKPSFGNVNKQDKVKLLIEFDQNYFDGNIDDIISLDNGEKIIELNNNIKALNNVYNRNFCNAFEKHNLLIEKNEDVVQIIKLYSDVLDNFLGGSVFVLSPYFSLLLKKLKLNFSKTPNHENLNELISYIEIQLEKLQILKDLQIKEMDERFNDFLASPSTEYREVSYDVGKLDCLERLKMITTFNEKVINYLVDKIVLVRKTELNKEILLSLFDDRNTNGRALQIYRDLREISTNLK